MILLMWRVAADLSAEVTQEVGVLFHHRDFYAGAGQQQAKHHARRSTSGDQTSRCL
jgi:hypothetical protein